MAIRVPTATLLLNLAASVGRIRGRFGWGVGVGWRSVVTGRAGQNNWQRPKLRIYVGFLGDSPRMELLVCRYCNAKANALIATEGDFRLWQCSACRARRYWCPSCDHGWLVRVRLRESDEQRYVCDECESTFDCELCSSRLPTNFHDWMASYGRELSWSSVEEIRENAA